MENGSGSAEKQKTLPFSVFSRLQDKCAVL